MRITLTQRMELARQPKARRKAYPSDYRSSDVIIFVVTPQRRMDGTVLQPEDAPVREILAKGVPIVNCELVFGRFGLSRLSELANIAPLRPSPGAVTRILRKVFTDQGERAYLGALRWLVLVSAIQDSRRPALGHSSRLRLRMCYLDQH